MKKIALLNSVYKGGKTYLEYLKNILPYLLKSTPPPQKLCQINFFQPEDKNFCGISIEDAEKYIQYEIKPLKMLSEKEFHLNELFEYDFCFFNDAHTPYLMPDRVCCITAMHGTAPMPMPNKYDFAVSTSYTDFVLSSNLTCLNNNLKGLSYFRQDFPDGSIEFPAVYDPKNKRRSYIRKTRFAPISPLKKLNFFHENSAKNFENLLEKYQNGNLVVGIMPTSFSALPGWDLSFYAHFHKVLKMLFRKLSNTKILFRPYSANFFAEQANIKTTLPGLVEIFDEYKTKFPDKFIVDTSGQSSSEFFAQCDVLITDGSTGGVSFLLNKAIPPIYYLENTENEVVKNFVNIQKDKVLFAHNPTDLVEKIKFCLNLNKEERIKYFQNYCDSDLFLNNDNLDTFQRILNIKNINSYNCGGGAEIFPLVNEQGKIIVK